MNTYKFFEWYKTVGEPQIGAKRYAPVLVSVEKQKENVHRFVISTVDEDRDGDILVPKGAILDNYKKNPTVLWAHDYYGLPIGRSIAIKVTSNGIAADVEFAPTEFAQQVKLLVESGFLKGASVGFTPIKWEQRVPEQPTRDDFFWGSPSLGYKFLQWEMLEWSIVAVPCNPYSLLESAKVGGVKLDFDLMVKMMKENEPPKPEKKDGGPPVLQEADGTCRDAEGVVVPCDGFKPQPGGNPQQGKTAGGPPVLMEADGKCRDAEGVEVPCGDFKPQPGGNPQQGKGSPLGKPFGEYEDFAACVSDNSDKENPEGYCAQLHFEITGEYPGKWVHRYRAEKFWAAHPDGIAVTREEMKGVCPECAEKMETLNISKIAIKQGDLPEGLYAHLCSRYGGDPGFFTACVDDPPSDMDFTSGVEGWCAWLHNECLGYYPGEEGDEASATVDVTKIVEQIGTRLTKIGAVLSRKNREKLEQAMALLNDVLVIATPADDETDDVLPGEQSKAVIRLASEQSKGEDSPSESRVLRVQAEPKPPTPMIKLPVSAEALAETVRKAVRAEIDRLMGKVSDS